MICDRCNGWVWFGLKVGQEFLCQRCGAARPPDWAALLPARRPHGQCECGQAATIRKGGDMICAECFAREARGVHCERGGGEAATKEPTKADCST